MEPGWFVGDVTTDFGNSANLVTLGVSQLHFVALQLLQCWGLRLHCDCNLTQSGR